jgi:hypothetical protein
MIFRIMCQSVARGCRRRVHKFTNQDHSRTLTSSALSPFLPSFLPPPPTFTPPRASNTTGSHIHNLHNQTTALPPELPVPLSFRSLSLTKSGKRHSHPNPLYRLTTVTVMGTMSPVESVTGTSNTPRDLIGSGRSTLLSRMSSPCLLISQAAMGQEQSETVASVTVW